MTYCAKPGCKLTPWRGKFCYTHWRISQGFFFDGKRFVKDHGATDVDRLQGKHLLVGRRRRRNTAQSARNSEEAARAPAFSLGASGEDRRASRGDRSRSQPELVNVHGGGATYA